MTRKHIAWTSVALLLLLALALTPPLLNVNRLQRRIAASMSASLGRPVHLDSVTLHLLPVPGFTLQNLVVSEDPAFGNEPTIRANTVEITLRPSSLWRRQVELASIRFVEPSLNLVRNPEGRWNLQTLLMHAASVDTAPTVQQKPGPSPRFPYIEATGARVNLKLGPEKQPFSLTDADFALWLPSPTHWRVRLEARPARTNTNISDPGTVRLEGALERAASMAEVPVDLQASWHDAPLGEASRILTGTDAGWRGRLTVEASLTGKLGTAQLKTAVHLNDLRRADFVPVKSLDLDLTCNSTADIPSAVLHSPACTLPPGISAVAESVDLSALTANQLRVGSTGVPESWLLDWARLFSQRIPAHATGAGQVSGSLLLVTAPKPAAASWLGQIHGNLGDSLPGLPDTTGAGSSPGPPPARPDFTITSNEQGALLAPLNLMPPGPAPPLTLSGSATRTGYTLRLTGTATLQQVHGLAASMPPLADGLDAALPAPEAAPDKPLKLDITCSRPWNGTWNAPQTCTPTLPTEPTKKHPHKR